MKPLSIYILLDDGRAIFSKDFVPDPPPSQLLTGMMRAMQDFIFELTGDYITEIVAGGFRFFCELFGPLMIVLVTSPTIEKNDFNVDSKLNKIGLRFMRNYGAILDAWKGDVNEFIEFENDIAEILGDFSVVSVQPIKQLTGLSLLSLSPSVQHVARILVELGRGTKEDISHQLQIRGHSIDADDLELGLLELINAGFIGYSLRDGDRDYFIS